MLDSEMIDTFLKLSAQLYLDQMGGDNRDVVKKLREAIADYAKDTWPAQFGRRPK